jgi:chitodextrinase
LIGCRSSDEGSSGSLVDTQRAVTAPIAFVQGNFACPQTPQTSVSVPFNSAQTAGNLNVVVIGWADTTNTITSVVDTKGNVYALGVGPTKRTTVLTQSIYYAKNIGAGTNSITVNFSGGAAFADVRTAEYSGIDTTSPFDVGIGGTGTNNSSSSGAVTTTNANDLIVGANFVFTSTIAAGTGFTSRRITTPDGDIFEDKIVTAAGSQTATAPLSGAGAWIMQLAAFKAAVLSGDTQAPTAPSNLSATAASMTQINLSWTAATDNVAVTSYLIERCAGAGCSNFAQIGTSATTSFNSTGLTAQTSYSYRVRASDAAGNFGPYSNTSSAMTLSDTQAPTAPSSLTATPTSATQINLAWSAATDNVAVTSYLIERCQGAGCSTFAQIATGSSTSFSDTGLTAQTSYSYRVRATDAASNLGPYSTTATGTTPFVDVTAPSAPSSLAATASSSSQIGLTWTAATDDVAVTSYLVERCQGAGCSTFAQIGTSATTSFTNTGLTAQTSYSYRVRASDAANNLGAYSNTATATTPSAPPPPTNPTFVQSAFSCPQTPMSSVAITFTKAQNAGDLNVVIVGWGDGTSTVSTITDSAGNAYTLAVGPTRNGSFVSQGIYYAKNIAAATAGNVVTVKFNGAAAFPDVRILEYAGIDTSIAVDGVSANNSNTSISDSGAVQTTSANDLLVAGNMVWTSSVSAGTGFTQRVLTTPDGDAVVDRVVSAAGSYTATENLSSAGPWVMQMVAFRAAAGGAPPDSTAPTVTITSPASGATLSGQVSVAVDAVDTGSGVASVQLLVDGSPVGAPDTLSPFAITLDTTQFTNDVHSIGAYAIDFANNVGNATAVSVTFSNSVGQGGQWSSVIQLPIVPVHAALLRTGEVLMWDGQELGASGGTWNPTTQAFTAVTAPVNLFCSGPNQLPDGRIAVVGGHINTHQGLADLTFFDPATRKWTLGPNMQFGRWYPGTMTLPDGRIITVAGEMTCDECDAKTPEIYNPATNTWSALTAPGAQFLFTFYPHMYLLPDGRLLVAGTTETPTASQILDVNAQTWTAIGGPAVDGGASAMYLPGKIIKTGKSVDPDDPVTPSVATAYVLDTTKPSPTWRQVQSMAFKRTYHTLTMLPDGNVLCTGGGPTTAATDIGNAILAAEIWSPTTETWTTVAAEAAPRLYHSEALLMPDARVLVMGGGRFNGINEISTNQLNAEFFSPPYLSKGPRPTITSAPSTLTYGQAFTVQTPDAARIASVSLIRYGAVTHSINMAQVYVPLTFTAGSGSLTVTAPASGNLAPPGYYMLFIVDSNGVPSIAATMHF